MIRKAYSKKVSFYFLLFIGVFPNLINCFPKKMLINKQIVNLRNTPSDIPKGLKLPCFSKDNPCQLSQLLLGEKILVIKELKDGWLKIHALEQVIYSISCKKTFPVVGYIKKDDATVVDEFPSNNLEWIHDEITLRNNLVKTASTFLGSLYCWGGRSSYTPKLTSEITGVDCSGLTNLVYRAHGLTIPKNSRSQFHLSEKIEHGKDVKPADLIFFADPETPLKINHVMIYAGDGNVIESAGNITPAKVRIISTKEKLGKPIEEITFGTQHNNHLVYFGSYLQTEEHIQKLRDAFLNIPEQSAPTKSFDWSKESLASKAQMDSTTVDDFNKLTKSSGTEIQ
jgi:hypothetical protein